MKAVDTSTITITFGDAGENHVGMQQLGQKLDKGFTYQDLQKVAEIYEGEYDVELIDLESYLPVEFRSEATKGASILIVRDALQSFEQDHDETFAQLKKLHWDSKFWSQKHGKVVNKNARHNCCFADFSQPPDLEAKKGTVHDFKDVPSLQRIREVLAMMLGERVSKFIAEGNYYFDAAKCGIGYHGDTERRCVIAFRFGREMSLCYHWYLQSERVGTKVSLTIRPGDMYVMSDAAVGSNWKLRKVPTLRHAAGSSKYTQ